MKKIFPLLLAAFFVAALAVPCLAYSPDPSVLIEWADDIVPLSDIMEEFHSEDFVFFQSSKSYLLICSGPLVVTSEGKFTSGSSVPVTCLWFLYFENDGYYHYASDTVIDSSQTMAFLQPVELNYVVWSRNTLYYETGDVALWSSYLCAGYDCPSTDHNKDNICDDCGFEFAVPRDYSPFTVKKFMNHIGQIFTSAVSWVGNVGSTILQQPLLLAFCALPLCGIGIGIFERLKTAS